MLTFIAIAVEELRPRYMRGYGEVPPAAAVQLNEIADALLSQVGQFDQYITLGAADRPQIGLGRLKEKGT
jgi:hypothetical protein